MKIGYIKLLQRKPKDNGVRSPFLQSVTENKYYTHWWNSGITCAWTQTG